MASSFEGIALALAVGGFFLCGVGIVTCWTAAADRPASPLPLVERPPARRGWPCLERGGDACRHKCGRGASTAAY
ncbi:MAG: hypothetical protein MZV64_17970 [Ignavibacteriales bacterium]|nr:hypothetical protein [Ignavibacteriales bacterium]